MLTVKNMATHLVRNKWFFLACCFLAINLYGVSRLSPSCQEQSAFAAQQDAAGPTSLPAPQAPAKTTPDTRVHPVQRPTPHTPKSSALKIVGIKTESPSFGEPSIRVLLSHPVKAAAFRQALSLVPDAKYSIIINHNWYDGYYAELRGTLVRGQTYTLTLRAGLESRDCKARLEQPVERVLSIPDAPPDIRAGLPGRYLSPQGALQLPLESINVTSYTLTASRLPAHNLVQYAMREDGRYQYFYGQPDNGLCTFSTSRVFSVQSHPNTLTPHSTPLRELLPEDPRGAYMIGLSHEGRGKNSRLLIISDIGITAKLSPTELLVWANSIHTLDSVSNATVTAWSSAGEPLAEGRTDAQGLARLAVQPGEETRPFLVTVEKEGDLSFLDITAATLPTLSDGVSRHYLTDGLEAFLYTDRGVYRPGETAHVRAMVRGRHLDTPGEFPVDLEILRPDGRRHSRRGSMLSRAGTVEFTVPWAEFDATGRYTLVLKIPGSDDALGATSVAVEDFAPPLIAAAAQPDRTAYGAGDTGHVAVTANYLYGAPAAGNPVTVRLAVQPAAFTSTNFPDYLFGDSTKIMAENSVNLGKGRLDAKGHAVFRFDVHRDWRPAAMLRGMLVATVSDQGGRAVTAYAACDLHAYPYYIGLRRKNPAALRPGDDLQLAVALAGTDGTPLREERQLKATLYAVNWETVMTRDANGRWRYQSERNTQPVLQHDWTTGTNGQLEAALHIGSGGSYHLTVHDPKSDASSSMDFFVGSPNDQWQTRSMEQPGSLQLELDKAVYQPGDTARLRIVAPFPGKVLLTIEQDRVLVSQVRTLTSNNGVFDIPIQADFRPNAHISATVIRAVKPSSMQQVYRASGSIPLMIDASSQRLQVSIDAPDEIRTASTLDAQIQVTGPDGSGQQAEFTLAAIDEGICMLTAFETPDPLSFFSALRRNQTVHADLYAMLLAEIENELVAQRSHTGGDLAAMLQGRLNPVRARRFKPLALWHGTTMTDSNGAARVSFDLPEFSGSVRLMAVAVDGPCFGSAQTQVRVRRPLTIIPSLPRFLAPGDTCQMTVDLHNSADKDAALELEIITEGPVELTHENNSTIRLAAGERAQQTFTLRAQDTAGTARITLRARPNGERYEQIIELPVRPPAPRQTLSAHAVIQPGEQQILSVPDEWLAGSASFSLLLARRPSVKLKGALDYLMHYPYGCLEQTISAAFPALFFEDMKQLFEADHGILDPSPRVTAGIERVLSMQLSDGRFSYWPNSREPYEWGSVYAMHYLLEAQKHGFQIPQEPIDAGLDAINRFLSRPVGNTGDVESDSWREDAALRAYTCRVLALAGQPRHDWTARLLEQKAYLDTETRLQLVLAMIESGRRRDAWNELQQTIRLSFDAPRQNGGSLSSPARTAALRLLALAELAPDDPRTVEAMQALEALTQQGRWYTTQENAMAFTAFARYMRSLPPDEQPFAGWIQHNGDTKPFTSAKAEAVNPMTRGGDLTLSNQGPATVYAAWQASGVPLKPLPEIDQGISIRRTFEHLDGQPLSENRVTQGELIIVTLTVDTHGQWIDNLVIEDLLPAGLEIENAHLKTAQTTGKREDRTAIPVRHLDIRDDRLILFANAFSGPRTNRYTARAVSPGTYALPHATVEAMYNPTIRSRSGAGQFVVEKW
jgi:hypothetical protein